MTEPIAILKITKQDLSPPFQASAVLVGSGFFVASGVMATCAHVLSEAFGSGRPSSNPRLVATLTDDAFLFTKTDIIIADEGLDLALVRVTDAGSFDADIFELATKLPQPGQKCILRGYAPPMTAIQGCSSSRGLNYGKRWVFDIQNAALSFPSSVIEVIQGPRTDRRWLLAEPTIILSEGDMRKGISGAPLIDVETGQVVGVQAFGPQQRLWQTPDGPGLSRWTGTVAAEHVVALLARYKTSVT